MIHDYFIKGVRKMQYYELCINVFLLVRKKKEEHITFGIYMKYVCFDTILLIYYGIEHLVTAKHHQSPHLVHVYEEVIHICTICVIYILRYTCYIT